MSEFGTIATFATWHTQTHIKISQVRRCEKLVYNCRSHNIHQLYRGSSTYTYLDKLMGRAQLVVAFVKEVVAKPTWLFATS